MVLVFFLSLCAKVSKDIRKMRVFEETLLSGYQSYLSLLNDYVETGLGGGRGGRGGGQERKTKGSKIPLGMLEDGLSLSQTSMQVKDSRWISTHSCIF